jgi:hypothetical protein
VHMGVTSDGSDPVCLAVAQSALIQDGSRVSQGMVLFSADFLELRIDMLVAGPGWVTNPGIPIGGVLIEQGGMTTAMGVLPALPNRAKRVGANIGRKRDRGQDSRSQGRRECVFAGR